MISHVTPDVAIGETELVAPMKLEALQDPAVPRKLDPAPRSNMTERPIPLVVSHVPVVSPAIVTDFFSHVLAEEIEYVNG